MTCLRYVPFVELSGLNILPLSRYALLDSYTPFNPLNQKEMKADLNMFHLKVNRT